MAFFVWRQEFNLGVAELDSQHQQLVVMLSDLHDAMLEGEGSAVLGPVFSGLVDYTLSHFAAEEAWMHRLGYPGVVRHRLQHGELTDRVLELRARLDRGEGNLTVDTLQFLRDWLSGHILATDQQLVPLFRKHGLV